MNFAKIKLAINSVLVVVFLILGLSPINDAAAQTSLAQSPMLTLKSAPGLVMLTIGRDLPLFKAAYNDVNDIDGDGVPDIYFKPTFKYDGYFAYDRCYSYDSSVFTPVIIGTATAVPGDTTRNFYKCPGKWSGNFLNWVTMARIDILRKVLYGGKRFTDTTSTVLERTYIPQDSTIWGKEYASEKRDGYLITDYTPLAQPSGTVGTNKHMFANVTLQGSDTVFQTTPSGAPQMIVYKNKAGRIWDLVATEQAILGKTLLGTTSTGDLTSANAQFAVRVSTCIELPAGSGKREDNCILYPSGSTTSTLYKPTGLLHSYGEAGTLAFGLLTSTYDNNYAGGVLRQNIDSFTREVNPATGRFYSAAYPPTAPAAVPYGIVHHLDAVRPWGFGGNYTWGGDDYTKWNFKSVPVNGEQPAWGNPLGEVMFEALNYFAGGSASVAYTAGVGTNTAAIDIPYRIPERKSPETPLNLKRPSWLNPYTTSTSRSNSAAYPSCARPIQMTIGDPKTSFDSDHLPGSFFAVDAGNGNSTIPKLPNLATLNVANEAASIWNDEGLGTKKYFIGEAGTTEVDKNPTAKTVTSFSNIRGHGPDATANQGSFYGASVARYGKYTGLKNTAVTGDKLRVDQISIALDSHIPQIKIPMANGKIISFLLISKNIGGFGLTNEKGKYQGTGAITAFFIDTMANTNSSNIDSTVNNGNPYYKFRVSFSDIDQGGDNESDAKVTYEIKVNAPTASATSLTVGMDYFSSTTSVEMHEGYVIGGTTADGLYLDVGGGQAQKDPPPVASLGYYLDTMPGRLPGSAMTDSKVVSGVTKTPTGPSYTNIVNLLPLSTLSAPRSFAVGTSGAGEFIPHDMLWYAAKYGGAIVDKTGLFKEYKLKPNGDPENYYFVNNPSKLTEQLGDAFQKAATLSVATASAVAANGTKVTGGGLIYQASFDSAKWGGELRAFEVNNDGSVKNTSTWLASTQIPSARTIVLGRGGNSTKLLSSPVAPYSSLTAGTEQTDFLDDNTLKYLLGTRTNEKLKSGKFRDRTPGVADTGNTKPVIGDIVNSDPLYIGKADFGYTDQSYDTFKIKDPHLVGVGSNDGAYRLVDALSGIEKLLFIPQTITPGLSKLANPYYTHQYYVDGPSAFGHVKFGTTNPAWHSLVAASLGAGGKAVFALDASATDFATEGVLWEYTGSASGDGSYLGNILNKPIIGQLNDNNKGVVIYGNGINSNSNRASLLVLNASNGSLLRICTPSSTTYNPVGNGLTSIAAITGTTGKIDLVYAADIRGNIWRFDPTMSNCSSSAVRVFSATDGANSPKVQPITGELNVIKAPAGKKGYMILFGTGRFASQPDTINTDVQTMYGVWDNTDLTVNVTAVSRNELLNYPLLKFNGSQNTREITRKDDVNNGKVWHEAGTSKGWRFDLTCSGCANGERFVDKVLISGVASYQIASILTVVPSTDACAINGCGWLTSFDPTSGSYIKTYETTDANSTQACGATPRGLFTTLDSSGFEYINLVSNVGADGEPLNTSLLRKNGGKTCGNDGCTIIETVRLCKSCIPSTTAAGSRRQVWRQLQ